MDSLINMDGISEVANNVINKISSAANWIVSHDTPQKIAVNIYIEEIKKGPYDPLTKAALISNAKETIREYTNQSNVVQKAISMLTSEVNVDDVSDDWVASFMDKVRLVSDEEFQLMWAKVLAGEMESPGSYSLRTLDTIKNLNRQEAELFQKVAQLVIKNNNQYVVFSDDDILNKHGVYFADFLRLEECGLFSGHGLSLNISVSKENKESILCNQNLIGVFHFSEGKRNSIRIGVFALSEAGRELIKIIDTVTDSAFILESLEKIKKSNDIILTAHNVIEFLDNGQVRYEKVDLLTEAGYV